MKEQLPRNPGWSTCQSIALELDIVNAILSGALLPRGAITLPEYAPLLNSIPAAWVEELEELMRDARGFHAVFEIMALLTGVLFERDYNRASQTMRSLTRAAVLENLTNLAGWLNLRPNPALKDEDLLADLYLRMQVEQFRRVNVGVNRNYQNAMRQGMLFTLRLIQGGDLCDAFWRWQDRFFEQVYAPWRGGRQAWLEMEEEQVVSHLGAREKDEVPPDLSWLTEMSPVLRHPGLKSAVEAGHLRLHLWVEPFGIPDAWALLPGGVVSTFSRPGPTIGDFLTFTDDLARRAAALSDPTRLFILRMIRNMDMTNTDMADYLKLARPTVSIHARILREAGLIRSHQEGRVVRHEIVPEEVHKLFKDLETFLDLPDEG